MFLMLEINEIMQIIYNSLYFFLPAYVANTLPGIFGHGRPIDLGHTLADGTRIIGNGVTIRGTAVGILGGTVVGSLQGYFIGDVGTYLILGFLLSTGALVGDATGSFIKRRLKLKRGAKAPLMDQLNFVVGGLVFANFMVAIPLETIIVLVLLTPFGHRAVNTLGYHLKMKEVPW